MLLILAVAARRRLVTRQAEIEDRQLVRRIAGDRVQIAAADIRLSQKHAVKPAHLALPDPSLNDFVEHQNILDT